MKKLKEKRKQERNEGLKTRKERRGRLGERRGKEILKERGDERKGKERA